MDGEKYAPERQHPHELCGPLRVRGTTNFGVKSRKRLVRRKGEPRVRMYHGRVFGRDWRRHLGRRHKHAPPCGRDVGANGDADRLWPNSLRVHAWDEAGRVETVMVLFRFWAASQAECRGFPSAAPKLLCDITRLMNHCLSKEHQLLLQ